MKQIGKMQPKREAYVDPEIGATVVVTSTAAVAQAYPASPNFMHVQATAAVYLSLDSTAAHVPAASIAATSGSTARQFIINPGDHNLFNISGKTTSLKYSVIGSTDSVVAIHFYGNG